MLEKHHGLQQGHIFIVLTYIPDVFAHTQILVFCLATDSKIIPTTLTFSILYFFGIGN